MTPGELRGLTAEELRSKSSELRAELFNVRVKQATGQLENSARVGALRRDIARVETVLRGKQGGDE